MNSFVEVRKDSEFWQVARQASQELHDFSRHGGPAFFYNLAATAESPIFARFARRALTPERATLLATNYGVLNLREEYGSLRPRGCTLTFKNDLTGPRLIAEALVLGHRLNLGFAADRLEAPFWERLEKAVYRRLEQAASD